MLKLGDNVRDVISGYQGVTTGFAHYITGCRQWLVSPRKVPSDGETFGKWLDEVRLKAVPGKRLELGTESAAAIGGPALGPKSTVKAPAR